MSVWSRIERRLSDLAGELIPDEFRLRLVEARDLLEDGCAARASEKLEELLRERPDDASALSLLGAARLELGDARAAAEAFGRAVDRREDMAEAWLGLGQAELALGDADRAITLFRGAMSRAGGERAILAAVYRGLGIAYRRTDNIDKAVRELRKAVAENADDPVARAALGEALVADERVSVEEARRHLDRAVSSPDAPAIAHLGLGDIALLEDDGERAREHFTEALSRAEPGGGHTARALLGLGDAAMAVADFPAAHRDYLRALELQPRRAAVHARIGDRVGGQGGVESPAQHGRIAGDGQRVLIAGQGRVQVVGAAMGVADAGVDRGAARLEFERAQVVAVGGRDIGHRHGRVAQPEQSPGGMSA
ncbi:MAG: tetratricopeptide repeat protein, partial [Myxococcota bacterium]